MDCLVFAAVSKALAEERRPEPVDDEDDYLGLGPEERRQRERRMRRLLLASGLQAQEVREMVEDVRESEGILRQRPEPPPAYATDLAYFCLRVLGGTCGALVVGWAGWAILLVGAVILILFADDLCFDDWERRQAEKKRADAEAELARVRAVLESTGNHDDLQDW